MVLHLESTKTPQLFPPLEGEHLLPSGFENWQGSGPGGLGSVQLVVQAACASWWPRRAGGGQQVRASWCLRGDRLATTYTGGWPVCPEEAGRGPVPVVRPGQGPPEATQPPLVWQIFVGSFLGHRLCDKVSSTSE